MVLAVDRDLGAVRRATDAAVRAWLQARTTVVETSLAALSGVGGDVSALVAAERGIVEVVADGDFGSIAAAARRLNAEGWRVAVLVAASQMGDAHRAMRGIPVRLQPWWCGADDAVLFGVPEVP
jgi:hypothetical protein